MAFRRSVSSRAKLFYQRQRAAFPVLHVHGDNNDHENVPRFSPIPISKNPNYFQCRPFGTGYNPGSFYRSRNLLQDHRFGIPVACAPVFLRNMSSFGEGPADKIEVMTEVTEVFGDKAVEVASQAGPVVNEVAIAAADSFFPVALLQYLIDYIHTFTGFNWWASIVLATVLIRTFQLPLIVQQLIATSKFTLLRPHLQKIKDEMQSADMSPAALAEGQARTKELFKEYGVTPFTPIKGVFIVGPVFFCFYLAINNMATNVQSFKEGGTLWFTDLATPDPFYILPVLTALTFWITVECNAQEGLEGNPTAGTIKNVSRVLAAFIIPLTATFPKAIFCYWITSNLYSLAYGIVIKNPGVKKKLGIPIIQVVPTTSPPSSPPSDAPAKPQRISSASVSSQRIKSLEREVKARKKEKKT